MSTIIPGTDRRIIVVEESELEYIALSVRAMNKFLDDLEAPDVLEESSRQKLQEYLSTRAKIIFGK